MSPPAGTIASSSVDKTRRKHPFHDLLAVSIVAAFLVVCVIALYLVMSDIQLEAAAAGVIGAILGYWANNVTQIVSYYYGSSSPVRPSILDRTVTETEVKTP